MSVYHIPTQLAGVDTLKEIEHLRAILSDPDTVITTVIQVRTENPAIKAVVDGLLDLDDNQVPPLPPEPKPAKKRGGRKPKAEAPVQAAHEPETVYSLIIETPDEQPQQIFNWLLPDGAQCNDVTYALKKGKIKVGDVLKHKSRGDYRVVDGKRGPTLERVQA